MRSRSTVGQSLSTTVAILAGIAVALCTLELAVRPFATPYGAPSPNIAVDSADAPVVTVRQLDEGIAESHFSVTGARLTGNDRILNAPTVVLLGDSYVTAREVADRETMGAWLERSMRAAGESVNVVQYGWSGASPAQYMVAARSVRERWHPRRVVIALSNNDMDPDAMSAAWPRLGVDERGNTKIVGPRDEPPPIVAAPPSTHRSVLAMLVRLRWFQMRNRTPRWINRLATALDTPAPEVAEMPAPDRSQPQNLPNAVVHELARAYGDNLALVYIAEVVVEGGEKPDPIETEFLRSCTAEHVTCTSTRAAMLRARDHGIIARGLATRTPGNGHLNAPGHRVVADVIGETIHERSLSATDAGR